MPKYIVQMRRGTTEEWAAHSDIIPRDGEIVIETLEDGGKNLYIGDGVTPFENLTPFSSGADIDEKLNKKADRVNGTVISANQTFADLREWVDGNPSEEDRFGYFVTFGTNGKIQKATSANVVTGVVIQSAGFSTGVSPDKLNEDDTIKGAYDFVAFNGLVTVRDDGTPIIGDYCIASDEGVATASPNSFGYKVVERVDDTHINIYFSTNADALKRLQDNIDSAIESIVIDLVTTTKAGLMSPADKIKLDAIEEGAQVNQNAFANVKVGSQTVSAYAPDSTVALKAGSNIEITIDETDNVVISSTAAGIETATQAKDGLMSAIDKKRLDNLQGVDVTEDVPADDVRIWIDPSEDYGDIFAAVQMTPQIVDSMAEMTDTSKLYVLTTDSHVYFYDNGAWQDSGMSYSGTTVVQETGDSSTSVMSQEAVTKEFENTLSLKVPKTSLPEGADLNTYTTPGIYKVATAAVRDSLINAPDISYGTLVVSHTYSTNGLMQFYFATTNNRVFFRHSVVSSGQWKFKSWIQIGKQADINNVATYIAPLTIEPTDWELGSISSGGSQSDVNYVLRTSKYYSVCPQTIIRFRGVTKTKTPSSSRANMIATYDDTYHFLQRINMTTTHETAVIADGVAYVRFIYGYTSDTQQEITNIEEFVKDATFQIIRPGRRIIEDLQSRVDFHNHLAFVNLDYNDGYGIRYLKIDDNDPMMYPDSALMSTPIMKAPGNYLCIPKIRHPITTTEVIGASDLYVYFYKYDNNKLTPYWDIFNTVDENNICNNITATSDCYRMFYLDDDVYFSVTYDPSAKLIPKVLLWDGEHIGGDISLGVWTRALNTAGSYANIPYKTGEGCSTITVPGTAKYVFIKNDHAHPETNLEIRKILGYSSDLHLYKTYHYSFPENSYGAECIKLPLYTANDGSIHQFTSYQLSISYAHPHNDADCKYEIIKDINDRISYDGEWHRDSSPLEAGRLVIDRAKQISDVQWECKKELTVVGNACHFHPGNVYSGIPYVSYWGVPKAYGWHVSKHTFINAANDEDSIFYNEHSTKEDKDKNVYEYGSGYGLVCSLFAGLAGGFPYPTATYYLHHNPDLELQRTNHMVPGAMMTGDHNGHTYIYEGSYYNKAGQSWSLYESAGPSCGRRSIYAFDKLGLGQHVPGYGNGYNFVVNSKQPYGDSPYDIKNGTITNGYARPYRGDKGIYTNLQDVKINIKENSTKLYVREYFITHPDNQPTVDIINWKDDVPARAYDVSGTSFIIPTEDLVGDTVQDRYSHSKFFAVWTEKSLNGAPPTEVPPVYECFEFVIVPLITENDKWSCKKVSDIVTTFDTYNQTMNVDNYEYHIQTNPETGETMAVKRLYGNTIRLYGKNTDTSVSFVVLTPLPAPQFVLGHKYYINGISGETSATYVGVRADGDWVFKVQPNKHIWEYNTAYTPSDPGKQPYLRLQVAKGHDFGDGVDWTGACVDLTRIFGAGNEPKEEYDEQGNLTDKRLAELVAYINYERLYTPHRMLNADDLIFKFPDYDYWYTRSLGNITIPMSTDYTEYVKSYPWLYIRKKVIQVFCKGHYGAYKFEILHESQTDPGPDPGPDPDDDADNE